MSNHGLQAMSIGFMIEGDDTPMVWRGPMVTQALDQLLHQTRWDNLDYLVVDLPPGTGDIQLTLAQKVPVTGAIIVTTPQDIALMDARKGLKMFEKVGIKIVGIVENMSTHICSKCGHEEHIFGAARREDVRRLRRGIPGRPAAGYSHREQADSGNPPWWPTRTAASPRCTSRSHAGSRSRSRIWRRITARRSRRSWCRIPEDHALRDKRRAWPVYWRSRRCFLARHFHTTAKYHAVRTAKYPTMAKPMASKGKPIKIGFPSAVNQSHKAMTSCANGYPGMTDARWPRRFPYPLPMRQFHKQQRTTAGS